jgi:hypothetical protein
MRYRLRTLLILLAAGPPLLATTWLAGHELLSRFLETHAQPSAMRCGTGSAVRPSPEPTEQDKQAWEESKAVSRSLGAPQPVPLPEGY